MSLFSTKNKRQQSDNMISQGKVFLRIFLTKDKKPKDYTLVPGEYRIGRGASCEIMFPAAEEAMDVAEHHATIKVTANEIDIEDHSKGETYLLRKKKSEKGFEKIKKESLEIGDRLRFNVVEAEICSTVPPTATIPTEVTDTYTRRTEKFKRFIVSEGIAEEKLQLFYEVSLIGRNPDKCSIIVDQKYELVSREHAEIIIKDDVCYFKDIGSTNGSYIRTSYGEYVRLGTNVLVPLHDNTTIRLGGREPKINGKRTCDIRYVEEQ